MNALQTADAYCRLLTSSHYENFAVASGWLRRDLRLDLARIYAFCRTTDDLGDESGAHATERLARWRDEVVAMFAGEMPVHPVLVALHETVKHHTIPVQPFLDLIQANMLDQQVSRYEQWSDLHAYCMLSAAPVGRMVLHVFGIATPATQALSDDVCNGLQLANHAQDVSRDARIGRCYLLQTDIATLGTGGAVRALVERARALLHSGRALEALAPQPLRIQLALYRLGGLAICDEITAIDYATEHRRPHVSNGRKIMVLLRAIGESLRPHGTIQNAPIARP